MAEVIEDAFRMGTMVLACASYDGDIFPPMHSFLHKLQNKAYQRRRVALIENGSWAPCAARIMRENLQNMKDIELIDPVITIRSTLKSNQIAELEALADTILAR